MYSEHGFDALMRAVFGEVCQSLIVVSYCMPGIAALPGRLGDLAQQVARLVGLDRAAVAHRAGRPLAVLLHRLHELVGDAHRVVRVLEEDRRVRLAGEGAVVAGVDQRPGLLLFVRPCSR